LYYFNARWYDPTLGRFITEDPARDGGNWFAYCGNNPLNRIDQNGLESTSPALDWLLPKVDSFLKTSEQAGVALQQKGPIGYAVGGIQRLLSTAADVVIPDTGDEFTELIGLAQSGNAVGIGAKVGTKLFTSAESKAGNAIGNGERATIQSWNEFQKVTSGMFKTRGKAAETYNSFERGSISLETAGKDLNVYRFHDNGEKAGPLGRFLTDTPNPTRSNMSLPPEWNGMSGTANYQIKPGSTYLFGKVGPQPQFGPQYTGGASQYFVPNLSDLLRK
jgi:hypothetical protein